MGELRSDTIELFLQGIEQIGRDVRIEEQPIFTCKAHVFHIDPKTKRSWISASSSAVAVSFFYDSSRSLYRIISVEGTKAVINSTITPNMTFTKTSRGRRRRRGDEGRPAGEREPKVDLGQGAVPVGHQPRRPGAAEEGAGGDQQAVWGPPPPPWAAAERTHSSVEHLGCHRLINFRVQSANVSLFLCFHYFSIVFFLR